MRRSSAIGLGFAIAGGEPTNLGQLLHLEPGRERQPGRRRLMAVVEPLDPTTRGLEVAEVALAALREGFWSAAGQPLALALGEAFAAANAAVRDENRLAPGEGRDRRVGVGATAIAIEGRQLVLAQVPPSQAILVQEGRVYAFPALASWNGNLTSLEPRIEPEPEPLGRRASANPDLYRTLAAPDDLVVLCASTIPQCLIRAGDESGRSSPLASFETVLRAGDPEAVAARLGRIADIYELSHAHAACCTIGRLHCLDVALAREQLARLVLACGVGVRSGPRPSRVAGVHGRRRGRAPAGSGVAAALPNAGRRRRAYSRLGIPLGDDEPDPDRVDDSSAAIVEPSPAPVEAAPGEPVVPPGGPVLTTTSASSVLPPASPASPPSRPRPRPVGGETGTVRGRRPLADEAGPIGVLATQGGEASAGPFARALPSRRAGRRIAQTAPGALGLERHRPRPAIALPGGWRLTIPQARRPGRPGWGRRLTSTLLAVVVTVGLVGAFGVGPMAGAADRTGVLALTSRLPFSTWAGLDDGPTASGEAALAAVDRALAAAAAADQVEAAEHLALAEDALDRAIAAGADRDAVALRQAELAAAWERLDGGSRIGTPRSLATLPVPAGTTAHLLLDGDDLLVSVDGLLRLSPGDYELASEIEPGQSIGGAAVDKLRCATSDGETLVLFDGRTLFLRDDAGDWSDRALPSPAASSAWPAAPCGTFAGNFYLLDAGAGRILKFAASDPTALPTDWAAGAHATDLRLGRDLVIDGSIHVLLADGRIMTFFQGALEHTYDALLSEQVADPVALVAGVDGRSFYVLDRGDGRRGHLYRLDRDTGAVQELPLDLATTPADATNLLALSRDLAVDEERGTVYLLTEDALWRAELLDAA